MEYKFGGFVLGMQEIDIVKRGDTLSLRIDGWEVSRPTKVSWFECAKGVYKTFSVNNKEYIVYKKDVYDRNLRKVKAIDLVPKETEELPDL